MMQNSRSSNKYPLYLKKGKYDEMKLVKCIFLFVGAVLQVVHGFSSISFRLDALKVVRFEELAFKTGVAFDSIQIIGFNDNETHCSQIGHIKEDKTILSHLHKPLSEKELEKLLSENDSFN